MKSRFQAVNDVYHPFVDKHLGKNKLQNILVCGGSDGAVKVENIRHKDMDYENIFNYELVESNCEYSSVVSENILYPDNPITGVNLIYADVGGSHECVVKMQENSIEDGVSKLLSNSFTDNNLGILVFLFFDGIGVEPFLDKKYGSYKSKDFFSEDIGWYDSHNDESFTQRLDGVVFYE